VLGSVHLGSVKVSVIVPAYNEEKLLPDSLCAIQAALPAFTALGWETEIVVCDNNSTDRTSALARVAGAIVVFEPVNQIARARNTGGRAASGDWFIFIDADSQPSRELFADVAQAMQSGRYLAGGCTIKMKEHYRLAEQGVTAWNWISRIAKYLAGSFIFCDAKAFRQLGGFSQELYASEEIEFSRRLKKLARQSGKKIVILRGHPLVTSARKLQLYTLREHLSFLGRTVFGFGRPLRDPKACFTWYDGRR
jgi:glycosyltransferase involved in cell wall biosynthesis